MRIDERKAGVVLTYAGQLIRILVSLIYTPVMLHLLGQNEYGLYQLVYSVVSYLSLLSLGFGSSYLRFYSRFKVKNEEENIAKFNGMFMMIFLSISIICIFCGIAMVHNIRGIFGSGLTDNEYEMARELMILMVFNLTITFPNSVFNCFITAHEKFLFQKWLIILENVCSPFLTLPLLLMGYGSVGMVTVTTILTILVFIANGFFCIKKLSMKFAFIDFQFSVLKEMWVFTFFIFLNQIIDQINWSIDKFLLGRLAGTTTVAIYGIGGQINSMYLQFSTAISSVFIPRVNTIAAKEEDSSELTDLFIRVGRIQFIVLMMILSGFIFWGRPFIRIWAGESFSESYIVSLLLIIPVTVPLIQNLGIEIQRAKNKHRIRSIIYACIAVGNIVLSIPLIKVKGATGAAIGTALSLTVGNIIFMNWYYHNKIHINIIKFWKNILSIIPALIFPCLTGIVMMRVVENTGILSLMVSIVIYMIFYGISMWLFGLNKNEKNIIMSLINKIIKN